MNDRIKKLRYESTHTDARIDMERARYFTECYKEYEGSVSIPELRALSLKHYFSNKTLYIGDGELISFKVQEQDYVFQEQEMIPYWEKRSIRNKILRHMTPEWKVAYGAGIFTEFMEQRGPGHTVGSENIFRKGLLEYKAEIQEQLQNLDYLNDPDAISKEAELNGMDIACDAVIILASRYADMAEELASACAISRKGWGQPAFYNTEAIVQELLNAGKSIEDARKGGTSGCVETGAFGNEAYILTGYFNLPKILELTLFNGYDHMSGQQLGPETGYGYEFETYEALW